MTPDEIADFLSERREARLGTIRDDGSIHLTPVWYVYEDMKPSFCLEKDRVHLANLRRRPSATLLIDEDRRPIEGWLAQARAVMFSGRVDIIDDSGLVEEVRFKLLDRYVGKELNSPAFLNAPRDPRARYFLIVLTPDRVLSWDFSKK